MNDKGPIIMHIQHCTMVTDDLGTQRVIVPLLGFSQVFLDPHVN